MLALPAVDAIQKAYVRKVIDTLHACANVLYEIQNEGDATSIPWQKALVDYIHRYEQTTYGCRHPVGLTVGWGNDGDGPNWSQSTLTDSRADWIAPGGFDTRRYALHDYRTDPPRDPETPNPAITPGIARLRLMGLRMTSSQGV